MAYEWPWFTAWEPADRRLGPALLRNHPDPGAAIAYARIGLESTLCPRQRREWREALRHVEARAPKVGGKRVFTLRQLLEALGA